jgi:hypothetical protein
VIRVAGDNTFLDQGPESWRLTVIAHRFTMLGSQRFTMSTDFARLYGHTKPEQFWIKIFNFDYDLRGPGVLRAIIQPFSRLLDLDAVSSSRTELRWARVLVEVAARALIPSVGWFELKNSKGNTRYIPLQFEIEDPISLRLNVSVDTTMGGSGSCIPITFTAPPV